MDIRGNLMLFYGAFFCAMGIFARPFIVRFFAADRQLSEQLSGEIHFYANIFLVLGFICFSLAFLLSQECSRRFILNITLIFCTLMICFGFAEILFRMETIQKVIGRGGVAFQVEESAWLKKAELNAFGFREVRPYVKNKTETFRIVVLGDSFTYGHGVYYGDLYTQILERKLKNLYPRKEVEIYNFGASGSNTVDQVHVLKQFISLVEPDMIIVGFVLNDPESHTVNRFTDIRFFPKLLDAKLKSASHFYFFLGYSYNRTLEQLGYKQNYYQWLSYLYDEERNKEGLKNFRKAFDDLRMEALHIPVVIAIFPIISDFQNYQWSFAHALVSTEARKRNFYVLDLLPFFSLSRGEEYIVSKSDHHPNKGAHKIFGEQLASFIVEKKLIEP